MTAKTDTELNLNKFAPDEPDGLGFLTLATQQTPEQTLEPVSSKVRKQLPRYYDHEDHYHRLRERRGDMPNGDHNDAVDELVQVLRWQYREEDYQIHREFNFYETKEYREKPLYPDVFLIKGRRKLGESYFVRRDGPPPEVIFEIISTRTRPKDIGPESYQKPHRYEAWGVLEYFAYDPREKRAKKHGLRRLWGWRLVEGKFVAIEPEGPDGRLWSEQLQSWLVPQEQKLKLYDRDGNVRLTEAEYAQQRIQQERLRAEQQRLEAEQQKQRAEKLAEKLRELGIDPDEIA